MAELLAAGLIVAAGSFLLTSKKEKFENDGSVDSDNSRVSGTQYNYPRPQQFYQKAQKRAQQQAFNKFQQENQGSGSMNSNVGTLNQYATTDPNIPDTVVNMNNAGSQLLAYQLYQQAVNASTPTLDQLNSISGNSQQQTGFDSPLQGGVSDNYPPYNILKSGSPTTTQEYQAVNYGNSRAQNISACSVNADTFFNTDPGLLPKNPQLGAEAWQALAPENILANQSFLSATQQMGVDTVLGSNKNASWDIRGDIPNPISVVSPWMNTTIFPSLQQRPIVDFISTNGLYGSGNLGTDGTYIGTIQN